MNIGVSKKQLKAQRSELFKTWVESMAETHKKPLPKQVFKDFWCDQYPEHAEKYDSLLCSFKVKNKMIYIRNDFVVFNTRGQGPTTFFARENRNQTKLDKKNIQKSKEKYHTARDQFFIDEYRRSGICPSRADWCASEKTQLKKHIAPPLRCISL